MSISTPANLRILLIVVAISIFLYSASILSPTSSSRRHTRLTRSERKVGLIFYSQPQYLELLNCYLQKNLARNGGALDEVLFVTNTNNESDLKWLESLVSTTRDYRSVHFKDLLRQESNKGDVTDLWRAASDPDAIYIKMDDDIVWLADDVFKYLIETLQAHPDALWVGSNVINGAISSYHHYRNGAIKPFIPEPEDYVPAVTETKQWQVSDLPEYPDGLYAQYDSRKHQPARQESRLMALPVQRSSLKWTPMYAVNSSHEDPTVHDWAAGAQQHYSLLWNLEHSTLDRYSWGGPDRLAHLAFDRYPIKMIAIRGKDVDRGQIAATHSSDEEALSTFIPKMLDRPTIVDTRALASHFSYKRQAAGLLATDVLSRYRLLAQQTVCKGKLKGKAFHFYDDASQAELEQRRQAQWSENLQARSKKTKDLEAMEIEQDEADQRQLVKVHQAWKERKERERLEREGRERAVSS